MRRRSRSFMVASLFKWAGERSFAHFGLTPSHIQLVRGTSRARQRLWGSGSHGPRAGAAIRFDERVCRAPEQLREEDADQIERKIPRARRASTSCSQEARPTPSSSRRLASRIRPPAATAEVSPILEAVLPSSLRERPDVGDEWNAFVFKSHRQGSLDAASILGSA